MSPLEKYSKIRVIGRGANGFAVLCRRLQDNGLVVIKEIMVSDTLSDKDKRAAMNEVQVLSMLRHPNIVAYYESFTAPAGLLVALPPGPMGVPAASAAATPGNAAAANSPAASPFDGGAPATAGAAGGQTIMIVMEYADGGTLADYLKSQASPLPEAAVLRLFSQILLAVHHVHARSILHRDLKTTNILVAGSGDTCVLKIADFGISKVLSSSQQAESVVGTPSYLSPELCEGRAYNEKSDIWALGCILYEIVCGKRLFDASNLPATVMKIMKGIYDPIPSTYSPRLAELIAVMVSHEPADRPDIQALVAMPFLQPSLLDAQLCAGQPAALAA